MRDTDTNRTIRVEEASELRDRKEWAAEQHEGARVDDVTVDVAYYSEYMDRIEQAIDLLEGSHGMEERGLVTQYEEASAEWAEIDDPGPEDVEIAAKKDVAVHVLEAYFGYGTVELGELVSSSKYEDGTIELNGVERSAQFTVADEGMALATADTLLHEADTSIDELKAQRGVPL